MSTNIRRSVNATDLTIGNPLKVILLFTIPLLLSNFFQQVYNLTDTTIIGHALGDDALSAIGSVSTINGVFMSLAFGLTNGFGVVLSKCYGASDEKGLKEAVANSIVLAIICSIVMSGVATIFLKPLMNLLDVPKGEIYDMAHSFISILMIFMPINYFYNTVASFLRAIGDSKTPLYILIFSTIINVGLDLLFVAVWDFGLPGAAIATVLSQTISFVVTLLFIIFKVPELRVSREHFTFDPKLLWNLFTTGMSFALMFTIVNIGSFILYSAINGFGKTTIAAHTTARKIVEFCFMSVTNLSSAMATFASQNHGAKKHDRVVEGLKKSILASFVLCTLMIIIIYAFGSNLTAALSGSENPTVLSLSVKYLRFNLPFFYALSILCVTRTTMQGLGSKIAPLICSFMELLCKVFCALYLSKRLGYNGIIVCEPMSWVICAIFIMVVFFTNKNIRATLAQAKSAKKQNNPAIN